MTVVVLLGLLAAGLIVLYFSSDAVEEEDRRALLAWAIVGEGLVAAGLPFVTYVGGLFVLGLAPLLVVVGLVLVAMTLGTRPEPVRDFEADPLRTKMPMAAAQRRVLHELSACGAQVRHAEPDLVSGVVESRVKPNWGIAVLLGLFCLVPAIYYIVTRNRADMTTFSVGLSEVGGSTEIKLTGKGAGLAAIHTALERMESTQPARVSRLPRGGVTG